MPCDFVTESKGLTYEKTVGIIRNIETTGLKRDGTEFPIQLNTTMLKDPSGKIMGTIGVIITKQKEEEAVRMTEVKMSKLEVTGKELEELLTNLADHISIVDKDFNVLWGNKFAKTNFGEKLIGMKCYTAYHGRTEKCPECLVEKTYKDGQIHEHEAMVTPEGGESIYFHCNSYVLKWDKNRKPEAVIEISKIITDKVKLEKEMEKLIRLTNGREEEMIKLKGKIRILEQKISKRPIAEKRK